MAFRAASAVQRGIDWGEGIYTLTANINEAKTNFEHKLSQLKDASGADDLILCFSCPTRRYFRHDIWPSYKGTRKDMPPLVYRDLKEWASGVWETKTKPNLEADDVLGILGTHPGMVKGEKIIVSHDKDLEQIPGHHMHPERPYDGVYKVSLEYGKRQLAMQVLTGDSTDNYPGCPGIGPKRAADILDRVPQGESYIPAIWAAYEKKGLTQEAMAVQINTARILTHTTYNFKTGEPILWEHSPIR